MTKSSVRKAGRAKLATKSANGSVKKSGKLIKVPPKAAAKASRPAGAVDRRAVSRLRHAKIVDKIIRTASPPVQPLVAQAIILQAHKYQVGELVYYTSPSFGRAAANGSYIVVKQLPSEGDDYQYRIKSSDEAFERVAKESQLDRA